MTLVEQIGTAAIAWDTARREVLRLKKERDALTCDRADAEDDDNGQTYRGHESCWAVQMPPEGDSMPLSQRCEPCQQNHAVHQRVTKAIAVCGGKLQRLRRLIAKVALT